MLEDVPCDVSCKCFFYRNDTEDKRKRNWEDRTEAFNLKIFNLDYEYCSTKVRKGISNLIHPFQMQIKALWLLNYSTKKQYKDDLGPNVIEQFSKKDKKLEIDTIDLRELALNQPIYVSGNKVETIGITWLKLIGIRQWCEPYVGETKYKIYYPKDEIDQNIRGAIEILSCKGEQIYNDLFRHISSQIEQKEAEGRAEGRAEIVRNMASVGMKVEEIAKIVKMTMEEVEQILTGKQ